MRPGRRPYSVISEEDRTKTLEAIPALVDAAEDAYREGWHRDEGPEQVYAAARTFGVALWPALAARIVGSAWP